MWPPIILVIILAIFVLFFLHDQWKSYYFNSKGIWYMGNGTLRVLVNGVKGRSFIDDLSSQYQIVKETPNKVAVSSEFGKTRLVVSDIKLIKSILVKDFDHFVDRLISTFPTLKADYLFGKMLMTASGERWKQLRNMLSPTFTTGKIKRMFSIFDQSAKKYIQFIESENQQEIDLSEGYSKFTMDIIASAACGIDSQAFNQKEPSFFEVMGKGLTFQFTGTMFLKFFATILLPSKVVDALGISFFKKEVRIPLSTITVPRLSIITPNVPF